MKFIGKFLLDGNKGHESARFSMPSYIYKNASIKFVEGKNYIISVNEIKEVSI